MVAKKRKVKEDTTLSPELIEIIRVKPEDTEAFRARQKYTIHPVPEGIKAPRGKYWCYICGDWRVFGKSKKDKDVFDYPRCESCNISLEDWYIRKFNGLFKLDK